MITAAEFKRQVSKRFSDEMRKSGFKGSGFTFKKENQDFLFVVYIEGGRWGKYCSAGFAIHPKRIEKYSLGKLDLKKLPIHLYEFKMGLSKIARSQRWEYSDFEEKNLQIIEEIILRIKTKAIPVIQLYCASPGILDTFEVADLQNFHEIYVQKTGTSIATTDGRFAWALAILFEFKNPVKAKLFAEYGLSIPGDDFFGNPDFERILKA